MKNYSKSATMLLMLAIFAACESGSGERNANDLQVREVVVETMRVEPRAFEEIIRVTGTVEAMEDATISAETSGRIRNIADRGSVVRQGDVLVELDDRIVRTTLEMARTNYELAEDALRRQEPLLQDSIISVLEYNRTRAQRDQARSQLEQAEKQMSDSRIEAPFHGTVEERMINIGELVNPGMAVLRLINIDRVRINAGVPERYINDVQRGTDVKVILKSYGGEIIDSEVSYAGRMIVPETRTFPIEIVMSNGSGLLKPEMVVNLEITRKVWDQTLVIPRTALVRDEDGLLLYVVRNSSDQRVAEARRVRTGPASGALIVIEDGLDPGDVVIVTGQTNVSDGDMLRVRNQRSFDQYR
jgi:membrane fusion protein, multidrug efflux system